MKLEIILALVVTSGIIIGVVLLITLANFAFTIESSTPPIIGILELISDCKLDTADTDILELISDYKLDTAESPPESDYIVKSKFITINFCALDNDKMSIDLYGTIHIVTKDYINVDDDKFTWAGHNNNPPGLTAVLTVWDDGELYGRILTGNGTFSIKPNVSDSHVLIEIDMGEFPPPYHPELQVGK